VQQNVGDSLAFKKYCRLCIENLKFANIKRNSGKNFCIMNATKDKVKNKIGTKMLNAILK